MNSMFFHTGPRYQRGLGIGSIFSGLFRAFKPLASMGLNFGKRLLTSDTAKSLGNAALNFGKDAIKNVAADVLEGKNLKDSLNTQIDDAKKVIAQNLRGSGRIRKRKKKYKQSYHSKKTKYNLLSDSE